MVGVSVVAITCCTYTYKNIYKDFRGVLTTTQGKPCAVALRNAPYAEYNAVFDI